MPIFVPAAAAATGRQFFWTEPVTGTVRDLTGHVLAGPQGFWLPPPRISGRAVAGRHGAALQAVRAEERTLTFGLYYEEASAVALKQRIRQVLAWFNPFPSLLDEPFGETGTLRSIEVDGADRRIAAVYAGGLDGDESFERVWQYGFQATVSLWAGDAFWEDTTEQTETFALQDQSDAKPLFSDPFFPILITSSTVLEAKNVNNGGDYDAWPIWTIQGPGTNPTLRNTSRATNEGYLRLNVTLDAGDTVIIDTRPGLTRDDPAPARDGNGNSLWSSLHPGSFLWPLRRGVNAVQVEMDGATEDSLVTLTYRRQWAST